ncbi:MAG: hypothetical protein WBA20_03070 [Ketobacter sp.]
MKQGILFLLLMSVLTRTTFANEIEAPGTDGPGALAGDFWQGMLELVLSSPVISASIDTVANKKPFYIPQAKSHGLSTFRNRPISFSMQAKHRLSWWEWKSRDRLSFEIISAPKHGRLEGDAPNLVYIPEDDYTGFDEIVFEVSDGWHGETTGTIDIKVQGSYTLFESGQVRPLALNSDASRLYALNTPDGRLEIFDVTGDIPVAMHSIPVGLEPIAIALRNDQEAWVVNTLSDSVSVVDIAAAVPHVKRTLQLGDEPQDIVFAGPGGDRAFIATAHRGQNSPSEHQPTTPGIDRADVWVFDADATHNEPLNIVTLFGMPPRGLAVSPDGRTVYAGIYKSGNQSTIAIHNYKTKGVYSTEDGKPGPKTDATGVKAPNTGVIVRYDGEAWRDYYGTDWNPYVLFNLPDYDVFEIDAMANRPAVSKTHAHVGNALFNLAVNPSTGALYVSNLEARNELRFEGHGERSDEQTLRGRFIENRITVIKEDVVMPRNLNPHLSDSNPDGSPSENARSLALPLQMQVNNAGDTLYLNAFGSSKVAVFDIEQLESDSFSPSEESHIEVTGGGPSGLVLDESRQRLFVLTRFDNGISVIDTQTKTEAAHITMYNPEPEFIVKGRPFLYDARYSSGRGDSSCASCHLFGDTDGIAWDLGDPDLSWSYNTRGYVNFFMRMNALRVHHPLKGPMLTQSLRGMEFQGPQHWRGDRTGGRRFNGESMERAAFKEFRVAFPGLLGRDAMPTEDELDSFADFVLQLRYPPSPIRNLDDSLTELQEEGRDTYFNVKTTGFIAPSGGNVAMIPCNDCHELDPDIERFGSSTLMSFEGTETTQDMKVAHLRNVYTRSGMFGLKFRHKTSTDRFMGDQVTGYGLSHDGGADTLESFLSLNVFHVPPDRLEGVTQFVAAMPTGMAPIVGQQETLNGTSPAPADQRIDLMIEQALAHLQEGGPNKPKCDLVVHGIIEGQAAAWMMMEDGQFHGDSVVSGTLTDAALRELGRSQSNSLNYQCAPPGTGVRIALDRDEDGIKNGDDPLLMGKANTSLQNADPDAEPEIDEVVDAVTGGYQREESQKKRGIFPSFKDYWAF